MIDQFSGWPACLIYHFLAIGTLMYPRQTFESIHNMGSMNDMYFCTSTDGSLCPHRCSCCFTSQGRYRLTASGNALVALDSHMRQFLAQHCSGDGFDVRAVPQQ